MGILGRCSNEPYLYRNIERTIVCAKSGDRNIIGRNTTLIDLKSESPTSLSLMDRPCSQSKRHASNRTNIPLGSRSIPTKRISGGLRFSNEQSGGNDHLYRMESQHHDGDAKQCYQGGFDLRDECPHRHGYKQATPTHAIRSVIEDIVLKSHLHGNEKQPEERANA